MENNNKNRQNGSKKKQNQYYYLRISGTFCPYDHIVFKFTDPEKYAEGDQLYQICPDAESGRSIRGYV